jgi:hypothetical protein
MDLKTVPDTVPETAGLQGAWAVAQAGGPLAAPAPTPPPSTR